jgi:toxin ParE1/3/4
VSLPVVVRPAAQRDILDASEWYDRQRSGFGDVFAGRVAAVIDALGRFPELYGEVGHGVRAATIKRHPQVIYYLVFPDRVEVLSVLHGGRDDSGWQSRI